MAFNVFELFASLNLDTSAYESGLNTAQSNAQSMGSRIGSGLASAARVGAVAIAGATTAAAGFAASSVRAGMDFDSSMSQVAATMGTTVDQITELRDFAQEMGSTTAFSATEAADALNYMALAGYDAETSMSMLPNVLNLAASGGIDLARASDMVTDAASALQLDTEGAALMVDQMAAAASHSNTSVEQLGDAFLTIGATASNLSGGTAELATVLGVLADNGIKGAEGGTHLRNMILSLTNPTNTAGDMLDELGIHVYDAEGNMRSMVDIIYDLQQSMEGMTQAEQDAAVGAIFNRADMASVNALLATEITRYDELTGSIEESEGAAQAMANTQLDNLAGDITLFQSALEGAKIAVSDALTPSLREFVQLGSEGLASVTQGFQEGGLEGAMSALGEWLSDALTMIIDKTPEIVSAGMQLLGALGSALVDNAPMIMDSVLEVAQMLVDSLTSAVEGDGVSDLVNTAMMIISKLGEFLVENAPALIDATVSIITQLVTLLTTPENLEMLINLSLDLILAIADGLVQAMPQLTAVIPMIIVNIVTTVIKEFPKVYETIGNLLGDLFLMILGAIGGLMGDSYEDIMDGLASIGESVSQSLSDFWNGLTDWITEVGEAISGLWEDITSFFEDGFSAVGEALSGWWDELSEWFSNLADNALTWASDMIDNFVSGISSGAGAVGDAISGIADTIRGIIGFSEPEDPKSPLHNFHTFAPDMIDLFTSGIYAGEEQVANAFTDVFAMPTIDANVTANSSRAISDMPASMNQVSNEQPNIIQVFIGQEKIDEFVVNSNQRVNFISGGRG